MRLAIVGVREMERRHELGVPNLLVPPLECHALPSKERGDHLERLREPVHPVVLRIAERVVLGVVPPGPQAEGHPPAADDVGGGGHLGQEPGRSERGAHHQLAELDPFGGRGEGRHHRPRLELAFGRLAGAGREEVVVDPQGVEADRLGVLGEAPDLRPARHPPAAVGRSHRDEDAEPHREPRPARPSSVSFTPRPAGGTAARGPGGRSGSSRRRGRPGPPRRSPWRGPRRRGHPSPAISSTGPG